MCSTRLASLVPLVSFSALAVSLLTLAAPAQAGPVTELEADGQAINNTRLTAQAIFATSFTPNIDPNVFGALQTATVNGRGGGSDVDFYSFQTGVGIGYFDIDNSPYIFDTELSLFDSSGTLLAFNDDSFPEDPGTAFGYDSFLGTYSFTQAGTYYIAVDQYANRPNAINTGTSYPELTSPNGAFGGNAVIGATPGDSSFNASGVQAGSAYRLNISLSNPSGVTSSPVPEASTWVSMGMGTALMGGLMLRTRRRRQ